MKNLILLLAVVLLQSCSLDKIIIRQTETIFDYGIESLYEETDLELAEHAIATDIKLVEGMLKGDPENEKLMLLASQALAGYALGFVEDENTPRAVALYERSKNHAVNILKQNNSLFKDEKINYQEFEKRLAKIDKKMLPALFWSAFSWAGYIRLNLTDPQAIADLPKVEAMMKRVQELDAGFFYGAADLFFGSIKGMKPRMLGGNPEQAKQHFEKNLELTGGKFLLTYVYYAQFYAMKTLDEDLFVELLTKVEDASFELLPQGKLFNAIAKKKAKLLMDKRADYF